MSWSADPHRQQIWTAGHEASVLTARGLRLRLPCKDIPSHWRQTDPRKTVCNWAFRAVWSLSFDPHGLHLHTLTSLFETLTVFSVRILRYNNIDMTENKEKYNRSPSAQYSTA